MSCETMNLFGPEVYDNGRWLGTRRTGLPKPDPAPPCQEHSETSREAAASLRKSKARQDRQRILVSLQCSAREGMTDEEIQIEMNLDGSSQRPRRVELLNQGSIVDSGKRRRTRSGRLATVWVAAEYAKTVTGCGDGD